MAAVKVPLAIKLIRLMFQTLGRMFPSRFGRTAFELWFSTTRFRTPDRELDALESASIRRHALFGTDIVSYQWIPEVEPIGTVLFIHGWSGRGTQAFAFVQPLRKLGYRVISFDAPAHGDSSNKQTSIFQIADALLLLQDEFGHFDGVIAHSMGGMTLAFAAHYGFRFERAVCIAPAVDLDHMLERFHSGLGIPESVATAMLNKMYMSYGNVLKAMVDTVNNARDLDAPALIIHDRDDEETLRQDSERLHQAWKGSELMLTDGLKHHRILRDDKVVAATVRFLQQE